MCSWLHISRQLPAKHKAASLTSHSRASGTLPPHFTEEEFCAQAHSSSQCSRPEGKTNPDYQIPMSTVDSDNTETPGQHSIDICLKNRIFKLGIVAHTFNPSPRMPEAGGSSGVQGQPGLQREFQDSQRNSVSEKYKQNISKLALCGGEHLQAQHLGKRDRRTAAW